MESSMASLYASVYKVITFTGSGSGFFIREPNYFITNYHVVEGHRVVSLEDQLENRYRASVLLASPSLDLAILLVEGDFGSLSPVHVSTAESIELGSSITVAGFPLGKPFSITEGIVSAPRQQVGGRFLIQTDAAINPGNSGGPMFNAQGDVVAVTVSKMVNADSIGFGIPTSDIWKVLSALDSLEDTSYHLQCPSCETPIATEQEHCSSCGTKLPPEGFKENQLSALASLVEGMIERMGIDPVTARIGNEHWRFYRGSAKLAMYVYNTHFLIFFSNVNTLPKKSVEPVFHYLLSNPVPPYQFGIKDNDIILYHCVHLSDLDSSHKDRISQELIDLAKKADEIDNLLLEQFGCPLPERQSKRTHAESVGESVIAE